MRKPRKRKKEGALCALRARKEGGACCFLGGEEEGALCALRARKEGGACFSLGGEEEGARSARGRMGAPVGGRYGLVKRRYSKTPTFVCW